MASVRKGREGNLRATPRAREKRGEERVLLPHSSRARFTLLTHPKSHVSFPLVRLSRRLDYLSNSGKMEFFFVTLRFLSNLRITLIASLFYFSHVGLVCFNVSCINQLKLSIIVCQSLFQ